MYICIYTVTNFSNLHPPPTPPVIFRGKVSKAEIVKGKYEAKVEFEVGVGDIIRNNSTYIQCIDLSQVSKAHRFNVDCIIFFFVK